ncbi:MAG: hypothetical protein H6779_05480 [Candidatus Nomurabacteria bacterium]|nr:MAG: hypothetical protein H6779_05480 [Candidatus Nomurabacteria bacterium]
MKITYNLRTLLVITLLAFFYCISFVSIAFAQDGVAGVGIKPAIIEGKMELGETKSYTVELKNLSEADQTFYLSKRDIEDVGAGGVPKFATQHSEQSGYELGDWVTLNESSIFIPAGDTANISFNLDVPDFASPGDHFGAIVVSVEPPDIRSSGASIGYEVANIISIRIGGDIVNSAMIRQFSTSKYLYSNIDVDFLVKIQNDGNTFIKPIGPLEVTNMFGKKVAQLTFNESQARVPHAGINPDNKSVNVRDFEISWKDDGTGFGRYEAVLSASYGDDGERNTMFSTVTFWILPMNIVGPALFVLVVVLLSVYFGVKLYIRRTVSIMTAGSARKLVRTRQRGQFPVFLVFISMLGITALFLIVLLLLFS